MKVLNYSINEQPQEELIITKLQAIQRYIELLSNHKYSHIDKGTKSNISALKLYKVTENKSIDISEQINKFLT